MKSSQPPKATGFRQAGSSTFPELGCCHLPPRVLSIKTVCWQKQRPSDSVLATVQNSNAGMSNPKAPTPRMCGEQKCSDISPLLSPVEKKETHPSTTLNPKKIYPGTPFLHTYTRQKFQTPLQLLSPSPSP